MIAQLSCFWVNATDCALTSHLVSPASTGVLPIERCALTARAVALIYNWWSWYVRLAHPKTRLEAITSRPTSCWLRWAA